RFGRAHAVGRGRIAREIEVVSPVRERVGERERRIRALRVGVALRREIAERRLAPQRWRRPGRRRARCTRRGRRRGRGWRNDLRERRERRKEKQQRQKVTSHRGLLWNGQYFSVGFLKSALAPGALYNAAPCKSHRAGVGPTGSSRRSMRAF